MKKYYKIFYIIFSMVFFAIFMVIEYKYLCHLKFEHDITSMNILELLNQKNLQYQNQDQVMHLLDTVFLLRDILLIMILIIMIFFSLSTFIYQKKEKGFFYFSILCFTMIIKITINSYYLLTLYSLEISNYLIKLNYISIALMAFAFLKLSSNQIRNEVPRLMKTVIHLYSLCFVFLIIILPVNGLLHFVNITESFYFIFAIFFIKKLYTLYKKGQKVLRVTLIAYVIFLWFIILDYLLQNSIIAVWLTEFISILILFIIICGITDIAKRYIKNYNEKEHMKILLENMYISTQDDQLKFLKAQIKPHFVHNALNSIISISRTDSERSRELLIEFSQYLRNSLDFENLENLIPIDREIQFIKSYLIIEKERFGEKINIEYDLDNINIKIPPLILQPLVENAIHHGIRKKANGGIINIYVKKYKNEIYIGVKDDGVGIPESKIDNLLKGIENNQGIGLFNINQRLMRIYQTSLKIENNTTGGVNIYFKVPIDKRGFISENRYNR